MPILVVASFKSMVLTEKEDAGTAGASSLTK